MSLKWPKIAHKRPKMRNNFSGLEYCFSRDRECPKILFTFSNNNIHGKKKVPDNSDFFKFQNYFKDADPILRSNSYFFEFDRINLL